MYMYSIAIIIYYNYNYQILSLKRTKQMTTKRDVFYATSTGKAQSSKRQYRPFYSRGVDRIAFLSFIIIICFCIYFTFLYVEARKNGGGIKEVFSPKTDGNIIKSDGGITTGGKYAIGAVSISILSILYIKGRNLEKDSNKPPLPSSTTGSSSDSSINSSNSSSSSRKNPNVLWTIEEEITDISDFKANKMIGRDIEYLLSYHNDIGSNFDNGNYAFMDAGANEITRPIIIRFLQMMDLIKKKASYGLKDFAIITSMENGIEVKYIFRNISNVLSSTNQQATERLKLIRLVRHGEDFVLDNTAKNTTIKSLREKGYKVTF